MVQGLEFDREAIMVCGMRNELAEEVAMRIVGRLCRFRKLSGEEATIPVRTQLITLQVQRDAPRAARACWIRPNTVEETHRVVGTVNLNPHATVEDARAEYSQVVLDATERLAIGKCRTASDPELSLMSFV